MGFEMYHRSVFPDKIDNNIPSLAVNEGVFPTGASMNQSRLRKLESDKKQSGQSENLRKHEERLQLAAKLALMLYREPTASEPSYTIEEDRRANIETEYNTYANETNVKVTSLPIEIKELKERLSDSQSYGGASSLARLISYKETELSQILDARGDYGASYSARKGLSDGHITTILLPETHTSNLRFAAADYKLHADYGLWGKWYDDTNGFHRGIDITFGQGHYIYSICDETVVEKRTGTTGTDIISWLVVEISKPVAHKGQYVTYMRGSFSANVGDILSLGTVIGTEDDRGAASNHHTHTHTLFASSNNSALVRFLARYGSA